MAAPRESRPFPVSGAFALSVAVHLLLVVLTLLFPLVTQTSAHEDREDESEITFTFLDRPDVDEDRPAEDVPPRGTEPVPLPVPPEPPAAEPALPEPVPETAAQPPIESAAPPRAQPEALPEPQPVEPEPQDGEAPVPERTAPAAPAESRQQPTTVQDALREFGDALSRRSPTPAAPPRDSSRNVIVPDLSQLPSSGFGVGNLQFESQDYDWEDYGRQIYQAIWRAWHNRLWLTTDEFEKWAHQNQQWYLNNQTQVRFVIERNGQVTGIAKEGASGCLPLDASALDALAEVILPPLPRDFPRDTEVVHARFIAIGDVRGMRPQLDRLKRAGFF